MKILCAGHLVRHPLGGHAWHHLQYLLGFERMGHEVVFAEHFGWPGSCYDPATDCMGDDPSSGIRFLRETLERCGWRGRWCYLAHDDTAHGMQRDELAEFCRECDVAFNLSNVNWFEEMSLCRRRVLVDTDPVFTQIGEHGMAGGPGDYQVRFTYGENVHAAGCDMPTGGLTWLPTRQPVVLEQWPVSAPATTSPWTTLINWTAYGERHYQGRVFGQKDREFAAYFDLPGQARVPMEIAINGPPEVIARFRAGGWTLADPMTISRTPWTYQQYIARSAGEFCVAKHAYVVTGCGWFSDRSSAYLAMGRPVILQDTGFSRKLPCGEGLLAFSEPAGALEALARVREDPPRHTRAARAIAEEHFDAKKVLNSLLERSL